MQIPQANKLDLTNKLYKNNKNLDREHEKLLARAISLRVLQRRIQTQLIRIDQIAPPHINTHIT